jgi:hypothetical protein
MCGDGGAKHAYTLHTADDGSISGRAWTNDDEDRGHPTQDAQWDVRYRNRAEALKATGGTHIGINGCEVTVVLDGRDLPAP